jgi:hypothetical protein
VHVKKSSELPAYMLRGAATEFLKSQGLPVFRLSLARMATIGGGPPYRLVSGRALYATEDLIRFVKHGGMAPLPERRRLAGQRRKAQP